MRRVRTASDTSARARMRPALAISVCLVLLVGCRFGEPVSLLDDGQEVARAVATLRGRIGSDALALNVVVVPDSVTIRAQNRSDRNRIDEWRFARVTMAGFNWDRVSGPERYEPKLINPDLEANLFALGDVDFAMINDVAREAIEHAALADKARVRRLEVARQSFPPPGASSGQVRWTADVASDRESAQIFADMRGRIVGVNLDGTARAKALDFFASPGVLIEAARHFRIILGGDPILVRVNIAPQAVSFETTTPDPSLPSPVSGRLRTDRAYVWSINGFQSAPDRVSGNKEKPQVMAFGPDEIDWGAIPGLLAAAKNQLGMTQGRVTGVELSKPMTAAGPPTVSWKVEVTNADGEKGFVVADATGLMRQVVPPPVKVKTINWHDPKTMADTFARLAAEFGHDRQYAEVSFLGGRVVAIAQDHMQSTFSEIVIAESGVQRVGAAGAGASKIVPFRVSDLAALTADRIRELEARTLATLKLPPNALSRIIIGRGSSDPSPSGNITIEIGAEDKASGRAGRVTYELDGSVIGAHLPQ